MKVIELVGPRGCVVCFSDDLDSNLSEPCFRIYAKGGLRDSKIQLCKKHTRLLRNALNKALEAE